VTLTRLVVVLLAAAGLVAAAPALLDSTSSLRDDLGSLLEEGTGGQSAQQISAGEFSAAHGGMRADALQGLVGSPEDRERSSVEGLSLECWYYGVAGGTGAYQFCFVDGRLSSKRRYGALPADADDS
jgi:hypothetical protein